MSHSPQALRTAALLRLGGGCVALALAGCSSSPKKPPTETTGTGTVEPNGGQGNSDDAGGTASGSCTFPSTPTSFALPTLSGAPNPPFPSLSPTSASCTIGTGKLTYSLFDMNGDLQPDLVATSTCDNTAVGQTEWLVYINDRSGFTTTPIDFALPPPPSSASCATTAIFDVNGDLLPDYVETTLCTDPTVGTSRWLVYLNEKTGFAQTSVAYALPPGFSAGAFASTSASSATCTGGKDAPAFEVLDINGDEVVDFVIFQSCTDPSVGTSAWQVYLGSASGAAQTAATFALPTAPVVTTGAFGAATATLSCSSTVTRPAYGLLDYNVDGKPDLVVTQECSDATVGTTSWQWYENSGAGFAATPVGIALPSLTGAPAGSFATFSFAGQCANGSGTPTYTVADIDGNTVLDLLVTRDCSDDLTGVSYWDVYPSVAGAGFSSPARKLALPTALGATSAALAGLSEPSSCTAPLRPAYVTTYLAGSSLELALTAVCNDSTVGDSRWLLYPMTCE